MKCNHIIKCAVGQKEREQVVAGLKAARETGDDHAVLLAVAQLTGPCCKGQHSVIVKEERKQLEEVLGKDWEG